MVPKGQIQHGNSLVIYKQTVTWLFDMCNMNASRKMFTQEYGIVFKTAKT